MWPNGSGRFPSPFFISSPRSTGGERGGGEGRGGTYPIVRFETDLPRIEEANNGGGLTCDHHTGQGCTNPPAAPNGSNAFYPWYHLLSLPTRRHSSPCAWGLTNDMRGQLDNFGGEQAAWGPLETTDYGFDTRIHNFARTLPGNPCP